MKEVHLGLDATLGDSSLAPLDRVRRFFELSRDKYREDGYLGCMLGGLGQELSGISPVFQKKIEACFGTIAGRIAACMEEAQANGTLPPAPIRATWRISSSIAGRALPCEAASAATRRPSTRCLISISQQSLQRRSHGP